LVKLPREESSEFKMSALSDLSSSEQSSFFLDDNLLSSESGLDNHYSSDQGLSAESGTESNRELFTSDAAEEKIQEDEIAIDLPASTEYIHLDPNMTFGMIKKSLEKTINNIGQLKFYDAKEKLLKDQSAAWSHRGQKIYGRFVKETFTLRVQDLEKIFVFDEVSPQLTVKGVKNQVQTSENYSLHIFTFRGKALREEDVLLERGICHEGDTLVSRIQVTIIDELCDSLEEIACHEHWELQSLISNYCQTQRRENHENVQITFEGNIIDDMKKTLFEHRIGNGTELRYKVLPYTIKILDSEEVAQKPEGESLEIQDHWTVQEVINEYSRQTAKPFMAGDKVMLQDHILDDKIPVWRLRIGKNSELTIEREVQMKALPYLCSDCGSTVQLKAQDAIQCRSCFSKILYKKRTTRACQYNCR